MDTNRRVYFFYFLAPCEFFVIPSSPIDEPSLPNGHPWIVGKAQPTDAALETRRWSIMPHRENHHQVTEVCVVTRQHVHAHVNKKIP